MIELGLGQDEAVRAMVTQADFRTPRILPDLSGILRGLVAEKP